MERIKVISLSSIKSKFIHREIEKPDLDLFNMLIKHQMPFARIETESGALLNCTTIESGIHFLRHHNVNEGKIQSFINNKAIDTENTVFRIFDRKDEIIDTLNDSNKHKKDKNERKEKKKIIKQKSKKKKIKEKPKNFQKSIELILPKLNGNICFLDFEFNSFNQKIYQAGIVHINTKTHDMEHHDIVFSNKRIKYNPDNYLNLSLAPNTINETMTRPDKIKLLVDVLNNQDQIVVFGGSEDRRILMKLGVKTPIIDIAPLTTLSNTNKDNRSQIGLTEAANNICQEYGKIIPEQHHHDINNYQQRFIEGDESKFKTKGKDYFFQHIGLHNAYNDAAITLFILNGALQEYGNDLIKPFADSLQKSLQENAPIFKTKRPALKAGR